MPKPNQTPSQQFGEVMGLAALIPISVMIGYAIGHYLDLWRSRRLGRPRPKSDKRSHRWGSL